MKIDILDTAMDPNGMSYFDLTERIETLEKAGAQIKDIKHISSYPDGRNFTTAILYEEPTIIQQQSFYTKSGGKEINQFLASHDVVKVDHTSTDYGEIITTIVYRKVIKKVDPWGTKQVKMNMGDFEARANKIVFNWCINRNLSGSQLEATAVGFETNPDGTTSYVANYVIGFFKKRIAYHECDKKAYIELIEEVEI